MEATILDIGLLKYFSIIFPLLLVLLVTFAILQKTKILSDDLNINSIIALAVAILFGLSPDLIEVIKFVSPWFILLLFFIFMIFLIFRFAGVEESALAFAFRDKAVYWTVIILGLVIFAFGFANVFGQKLLPATQTTNEVSGENVEGGSVSGGNFQQNLYNTLFNPKIIGLIFVMLIAIFTISLITRESI